MSSGTSSEYSFALCLSHDVDRIYKPYQYVWNTVRERDIREVAGLLSPKDPYWTFGRTMDIEAALGVRSSFNVLNEIRLSERPKSEWLTKDGWTLLAGRYDIEDSEADSSSYTRQPETPRRRRPYARIVERPNHRTISPERL